MIRYKHPRIGIFNIDTNVYGPNGWIVKEEECKIIGETRDGYITRFLTSSDGMWDEMGRYEVHYTVAIEIHKSRFVKWAPTQLQLFN